MATIIIVDRIARGSKIQTLARRADGDIVQMSMAYWPQEVARILNERMGFEHPLVKMPRAEVGAYLTQVVNSVPLAQFLPNHE